MKRIVISLTVLVGVILLVFTNLHLSTEKQQPKRLTLTAVEQTLTVNGKKKKVFNLVQPDGTEGFVGKKGGNFNVRLVNKTSVPISIHWHGLVLPNDQDGVPYVTQLPIQPGKSHDYFYPLLQAGTFWMHSHFRFHEQDLMSAPYILKDPEDGYFKDKDVVVMLNDFTFKNPKTIFKNLQNSEESKPTLNDVKYDAILANRRTLRKPQIVRVKSGERVRLRMINGSSASNYWVNTGKLQGTAIAVDGNLIQPIEARQFQLAVAQRIDIEVVIPKKGGAFPILAQVEGTKMQAGIVLATKDAIIPKLSETAKKTAPALDYEQELKLHAMYPIDDRELDSALHYKLSGKMKGYVWEINNQVWPRIKPYKIKEGDRVEMVFKNDTGMAHPMHFHGHMFHVVEINNTALSNGPMRDTILVLPHTTQKVVFDADNPGIWMTHCHVLYHMAGGMMTTTNYTNYSEPEFYRDLINGKIKE